MSDDREARVLAAGDKLDVNGELYTLRPIVAQHLVDLEREALEHYKAQYLETFVKNKHLLGDKADEVLLQKMEEVARWDLNDLPRKVAFDVSRVPITEKLKKWVEEKFDEVPETDAGIRSLVSTALDQERITSDQIKEMSGKGPLQGMVRYDQWWVTASTEGMVSFITSSVCHEHPNVTRKVVASWPFSKITEASRRVEKITSADMGNM